MRYINKILVLYIIFTSIAFSKISPFIPKYRLENLKAFVDSKNLYYFNNSSGDFVMNKGFKSYKVIKGEDGQTNYNAYLSGNYKFLLIEEVSDYLAVFNVRKSNKIWLSEVGSKKATRIGVGVNPQFHLGGSWISFFNPSNNMLSIVNLKTKDRYLNIRVNQEKISYFIPEVVVNSNLDILYSQINSNNEQEIVKIDRNNKKEKILKATKFNSDFSMCTSHNRVFIKESFTQTKEKKSSLSLYTLDSTKAKRVYESKGIYPGPLYCVPNTSKIVFLQRKTLKSKEVPLSHTLLFYDSTSLTLKRKNEMIGELSLFLNGDKLLMSNDSKVYIYSE